MAKLIPRTNFEGTAIVGYLFWCPACRALHPFSVSGPQPLWWFDGNMESPSFSPSLRMLGSGCHLYVSGGQISYCNDCPHEFRNKTIPMVDWDFERWCPVSTLHTINGKPMPVLAGTNKTAAQQAAENVFAQSHAGPPPMVGAPSGLTDSAARSPSAAAAPAASAPANTTHKPECGEVGNVGATGSLGSNAKE